MASREAESIEKSIVVRSICVVWESWKFAEEYIYSKREEGGEAQLKEVEMQVKHERHRVYCYPRLDNQGPMTS